MEFFEIGLKSMPMKYSFNFCLGILKFLYVFWRENSKTDNKGIKWGVT